MEIAWVEMENGQYVVRRREMQLGGVFHIEAGGKKIAFAVSGLDGNQLRDGEVMMKIADDAVGPTIPGIH